LPVNWADFLAIPLFATTRLIIIRRASELTTSSQDDLATILPQIPNSTILVLWDSGTLTPQLSRALVQHAKTISLQEPNKIGLVKFVQDSSARQGEPVDKAVAEAIVERNGSDLWAIDSALFGYLAGGGHLDGTREEATVDSFKLLRLSQAGQFAEVAETLVEEYQAGRAVELLIGSIAAGIRKSRLSQAERLAVVELLADTDLALKTGLLEDSQAVALLKCYLPKPTANRLQWEVVYDEISH
jgi:DNA polymerase III delta subunit